jgi:hypothetical protein
MEGMTDEGGKPAVSPKMTGELWLCLGIGLTALAWNALHWWSFLILAGCVFAYLVQRGRRIAEAQERAALLARLDSDVRTVADGTDRRVDGAA